MSISLRPEETLLFEGDATLIKSKLTVQQTEVIITSERLIVGAGNLLIDKSEIVSAVEGKHGFTPKIVFTLRDGRALSLTAADQAGFKAAAFVLTGQAQATSLPVAPPLSQARKGTAWLAAFGPVISSVLIGILGILFWGSPERWGILVLLQILLFRLIFMWLMMRIDYLALQMQGYPVKQLGLADPWLLPGYLFSRAKVFGHSKKYGITWCVLLVIDLLLTLLSLLA